MPAFLGAVMLFTMPSYAPLGASMFVVGVVLCIAAVIAFVKLSKYSEQALLKYHETMVSGKVVKVPAPSKIDNHSYKIVAVVEGINMAGNRLTQEIRIPLDQMNNIKVGDSYPWSSRTLEDTVKHLHDVPDQTSQEEEPAPSPFVKKYEHRRGAAHLIGLDEKEFLARAKESGWTTRLSMKDGEGFFGSADVNDKRLNYAVINDKVVHITIG